jgi:hypothetical protein
MSSGYFTKARQFAYIDRVCKPGARVVYCLPLPGGGWTCQTGRVVRGSLKQLEVCMDDTGNMMSFGVPRGRHVFGKLMADGRFAPVNAHLPGVVYDSTYTPTFS